MKLGDRIKRYEHITRLKAIPRMPLIIRVDGRAFHTFTKNMDKPFSDDLINAMVYSAMDLAKEMQGFKIAYVQSDEATFCLTDYDSLETKGWFDYDLTKIISLSASYMSVSFNHYISTDKRPIFDSRAFSVPISDVTNVFLWRSKDWERNSLQMYARSIFSHKELQGKNKYEIHEMLYQKGKNWATDLTQVQKNGTFIIKTEDGLRQKYLSPKFEILDEIINPLIKYERN